jgi:hypothetical protein
MKKIIFVLMAIMAISLAAVDYDAGYVTGTTDSTYTANKINVSQAEEITVLIKNTDSGSTGNTIYYKVVLRAIAGSSVEYDLIDETSLAADGVKMIGLEDLCAGEVVIYLKSNSGHNTYRIDYMKKE